MAKKTTKAKTAEAEVKSGPWWDGVEPPVGWNIGPDGEPGTQTTPDPSPLEEGVWLWPAYTTEVPPLEENCRWNWDEMAWEPYAPPPEPAPEPEPEPLPPAPSLIAIAELHVENGEVTGIESASGIGFAFMMDEGCFWLFFSNPQPDTKYLPFVQSLDFDVDVRVTARETDYLEVSARSRSTNEPAIPEGFAITVQRTQ